VSYEKKIWKEQINMKKYIIKLNGKVYEVEMEEVTGEAATTATETVRTIEPQIAKPVAAQSSEPISGGEAIEAPMPGTIVNVAVKPGDKVTKNQLLVVLEAMKMENEIVSPREGTILSVNVSKGQGVNPGELLVKIG
jgi:biotin carboxyl carrier protein